MESTDLLVMSQAVSEWRALHITACEDPTMPVLCLNMVVPQVVSFNQGFDDGVS